MNRTLLLVILIVIWVQPHPVNGHSVQVFASVENGIIKGEATLAGSRPAKNGGIKVIRTYDQKLLLTTTTDDSGMFAIDPAALGLEKPTDLIIVLDAGPGHRSEWQLSANDFVRPETTDVQSRPPEEKTQKSSPLPSAPPLKNVMTGIISIVGLGALIRWSRSRRGEKK